MLLAYTTSYRLLLRLDCGSRQFNSLLCWSTTLWVDQFDHECSITNFPSPQMGKYYRFLTQY
jgi:hypothetical protein